jgi:hypothetical protein
MRRRCIKCCKNNLYGPLAILWGLGREYIHLLIVTCEKECAEEEHTTNFHLYQYHVSFNEELVLLERMTDFHVYQYHVDYNLEMHSEKKFEFENCRMKMCKRHIKIRKTCQLRDHGIHISALHAQNTSSNH